MDNVNALKGYWGITKVLGKNFTTTRPLKANFYYDSDGRIIEFRHKESTDKDNYLRGCFSVRYYSDSKRKKIVLIDLDEKDRSLINKNILKTASSIYNFFQYVYHPKEKKKKFTKANKK